MNKKELVSESLKNTPLALKGRTLAELAEQEQNNNRQAPGPEALPAPVPDTPSGMGADGPDPAAGPGASVTVRGNYTFYLSQPVMEHLQRMVYWEGLRQKKQGASYIIENLLVRFMKDKKDYPPIPDTGMQLEF